MYTSVVEDKATARVGVLKLIDEAIATPGVAVGICSAATRAGFDKVVDKLVGRDRLQKLDVIIAGDDVDKKKPDPMIYRVASERIGIHPSNCVVVEDSLVGLRAAKSAGMNCVITYTSSTDKEAFYGEGANAKMPDLSVGGGVTLDMLFDVENGVPKTGADGRMLDGLADESDPKSD